LEDPRTIFPAIRTMHDQPTCNRCGSARTQVMAQSVSPPGTFIRCLDCGHSTLVSAAPAKPTPVRSGAVGSAGDVDRRRIERLVTSVIESRPLPWALEAVEKTAAGWRVMIRTEAGDFMNFEFRADALSVMRAAIERALSPEAS
jgi:hypothetical protein